MGWKRTVFDLAAHGAIRLLGLNGSSRAAAEFAALIEPVYVARLKGRSLKFASAGVWPHYRARTVLTKEPETIRWLDGLQPGDVLYDIGANIGVYALYAAVLRGCTVVAIEPNAKNYAALARNIELNGADAQVWPLCVALTDRTRIGHLQLQTTAVGGALSSFGEAVDQWGRAYAPVFQQAVLGETLDELVSRYRLPPPQHVKIDVDGFEDRVVAGAQGLLQDPLVRSVMMELHVDREPHRAVVRRMEAWGYLMRPARDTAGPSAKGPAGIRNYLFERRHT